jgi:hypothetical protein
MPQRIASPEQSQVAKAAMSDFSDVRTGAGGAANRYKRTRPLSKFEREALRTPVDTVYGYNISPIFLWRKEYPRLGIITLRPRKDDEPYSEPVILDKRLVRPFDGGNSIQRLMVEMPLDLMQDFFVCSPEFPGRPENNLLSYGCFYTVGNSIEELKPDERQKILDEAELKHRNRCLEKINSADAMQNTPFRSCIGEVHKKCALYAQQVGIISELPDWVSRRGKLNTTSECVFCGFENKRGVAKCRNCHEILDKDLYNKLQKEITK